MGCHLGIGDPSAMKVSGARLAIFNSFDDSHLGSSNIVKLSISSFHCFSRQGESFQASIGFRSEDNQRREGDVVGDTYTPKQVLHSPLISLVRN